MIAAAVTLARSSLPSVLVLAASLLALANLLSGEPDGLDSDPSAIPSVAPLPPLRQPAAPAILASALFDPGRRAETISGSIDDLRLGQPVAASPVTIAGVLLSGRTHRAMLSLGGGAPAWSGVGAELGGWRVAAIDAEGAVLEHDGQTITLKVADRYKLRGKPSAEAGEPGPGPDAAKPPAGDAAQPPAP